MARHAVLALLLLPAALLAARPAAAQLPNKDTCLATASAQGDNIQVLAPCANGPSESCCKTINGFAGPGAPLDLCLCYTELLDTLYTTVESNSLARRFGVDRGLITNVLQSCGVPFAQGSGSAACPAAAAAGGAGVAVTAPGTIVGVAPGGATTVTAPGTKVQAGAGGTSVTAPFTNVQVGGGGAAKSDGGAAKSGASASAGAKSDNGAEKSGASAGAKSGGGGGGGAKKEEEDVDFPLLAALCAARDNHPLCEFLKR